MHAITTIGLDIAKSVFQVHGVDAEARSFFGSRSIKDGGKAPTYLIPLTPAISMDKLQIYEDLWLNANILI